MAGDNSIDSILILGERIEWSASPAWALAARPPRRGLVLLGITALAILVSLITVVVIDAGDHAEPQTIRRSSFAVAILVSVTLTVYFWIKAVGRAFTLFERPAPRREEIYVLTDRRLIVASGKPPTAQIVTSASYLLEATLKPNGSVHDLALWFGPRGEDDYYDYGDPLLLRALENGAEVQQEIVKRFGPAKWEPKHTCECKSGRAE